MTEAAEVLFSVPNFRDVLSAIGSLDRALDDLAKSGKAAGDKAAKDSAKGASDAAKSVAREASAARKVQEKEARELVRIKNAVNQLEVKDWQDKERAKTRSAESEAKAQTAAAKRAASEASSAHEKSIREMEARAKRFGSAAGSSTTRALGAVGRAAVLAGTLGGGFGIADSLGKGIQREATAGVIFRGAAQKGEFKDQKDVESLASATAIATGGTTEDMLAGLDMFVRKTGDLGVAKTMLEDLAKIASATGTNFADMGNTAAEVFNQLGDADKTKQVMLALVGQGKAGAIDIKDLGQYGGRLASSAAQYTGDLAGNIESFGAIAQLSKKLGGATDTAEATESVARLGSDMKKHELGFKDAGVDVYADKGHTKLRNAEDVIVETVSKTKGDLGKLNELFGERSIKAAIGAQVAYTNAGGGKAGEAAIRQQFTELKSNTPTQGDIDEGVKARLAETQAKLNVAMEKLTTTVNDQLMPILPRLIEQIVELVPSLQKFLQFITSLSPWEGIGLLVGAAIAKDIAAAGVGSVVSGAVTGLAKKVLPTLVADSAGGAIGATTAGVGAAEGAAAGTTAAGAAGAGLLGVGATALGGIAAVTAAGAAPFLAFRAWEQSRGTKKAESLLGETTNSPEEMRTKLAALQGMVGRVQTHEAAKAEFGSAGANTDKITPGQAKALADQEAEGASRKMAEMKTQIDALVKALAEMTDSARKFSEVTPPSGGDDPSSPNHPSRGGVQ